MNASASHPKHTVVIIGGGTGGAAVAARLHRRERGLDIAVVDPAREHFYQPAWTLVGGGAYDISRTRQDLDACLPRGVRHIVASVVGISPDAREVHLDDGTSVGYEYLVVAAGIQLNWDAIPGLVAALGKDGVTSNYRADLAPYTWQLVRKFKGGTAVFTQPAGAVKCPGAPQKALYLAADAFRRQGTRVDSIQFRSGGPSLFGVAFFAPALTKVMASYHAEAHYRQNLVEVRGQDRVAVFESTVDGRTVREDVRYDLLHVVPPQGPPAFIRGTSLADAGGWLEVDKQTLRHVRYANVYGLGDCTSTPNSKTAAAIKAQAPVLAANLLAAIHGQAPQRSYDGYAACPITTSRGRVMLAEFRYGGEVAPSLPLDPRIPRRFYWWLKCSFLPWFYWHLLLKGRDLWMVRHRTRRFPVPVPPIHAW